MYRNIYIDRSKYTCIMEIENISTRICNTFDSKKQIQKLFLKTTKF